MTEWISVETLPETGYYNVAWEFFGRQYVGEAQYMGGKWELPEYKDLFGKHIGMEHVSILYYQSLPDPPA